MEERRAQAAKKVEDDKGAEDNKPHKMRKQKETLLSIMARQAQMKMQRAKMKGGK